MRGESGRYGFLSGVDPAETIKPGIQSKKVEELEWKRKKESRRNMG